MRGQTTSPDLARTIYHYKDHNPDCTTSGMARILGVRRTTIRMVLGRRVRDSSVQKLKERGRRRCTTARQDRLILQYLRRRRFDCLNILRSRVNLDNFEGDGATETSWG